MKSINEMKKGVGIILTVMMLWANFPISSWAVVTEDDLWLMPQTSPGWQTPEKRRPPEGWDAGGRKKDEVGNPPEQIETSEPLTAPVMKVSEIGIYGDTNGNGELDEGKERWQVTSTNGKAECIKREDGKIVVDLSWDRDGTITEAELEELISNPNHTATVKVDKKWWPDEMITLTLHTYAKDTKYGNKFTVKMEGKNYYILVDEKGQLYRYNSLDETVEKLNLNLSGINFSTNPNVLAILGDAKGDGKIKELKSGDLLDADRELHRGNAVTIDSFNSRLKNDAPPAVRLLTKGDLMRKYVGYLSDKNPQIRANAVKGLGELYKNYEFDDCPAFEFIAFALGDENEEVRISAISALALIGKLETKLLIDILVNSQDNKFKERIIETLKNTGMLDGVVRGLIRELGNKDSKVREGAKEILVRIGEPAVKPLIEVLDNRDAKVRLEAVKVLGEIGGLQVIEPLIKMLGDPDVRIREVAANGLVKIGEPAVKVLIKVLRDSNEESAVQDSAAFILGQIGEVLAKDRRISHSNRYYKIVD